MTEINKKKAAWVFATLYSILIAFGINVFTFIFRALFGAELFATIISESFFTIIVLISGITLILMFERKALGWTFIIGGILNVVIWIWLLLLLSSHGW